MREKMHVFRCYKLFTTGYSAYTANQPHSNNLSDDRFDEKYVCIEYCTPFVRSTFSRFCHIWKKEAHRAEACNQHMGSTHLMIRNGANDQESEEMQRTCVLSIHITLTYMKSSYKAHAMAKFSRPATGR